MRIMDWTDEYIFNVRFLTIAKTTMFRTGLKYAFLF